MCAKFCDDYEVVSEQEFYRIQNEITHYGCCERCEYGIDEDCFMQCEETYNDYLEAEKNFVMGIVSSLNEENK